MPFKSQVKHDTMHSLIQSQDSLFHHLREPLCLALHIAKTRSHSGYKQMDICCENRSWNEEEAPRGNARIPMQPGLRTMELRERKALRSQGSSHDLYQKQAYVKPFAHALSLLYHRVFQLLFPFYPLHDLFYMLSLNYSEKNKVSCSVMSNSVTLLMVTHQVSLSRGLFRQEYWSGFPFPSPGDLPYPGIEPGSPALQADSLLTDSSSVGPFGRKDCINAIRHHDLH